MSSVPGLAGTGLQVGANRSDLRQRAQDLEGVFLNTLMKEMTSNVQTDGPFGGGYAEETWRSMQAEQMAQSVAETGGIGLAEDIMRQLIDLQAAQPNSTI